jgi:hypothetical protein
MMSDERDAAIGDLLEGAVRTIEPDADRSISIIRRRGSTRRAARWLAIATSLSLFVAAVGWAALRLRPDGSGRSGDAGQWPTYRDPALRWTVQHPSAWYVTPFENVCGPKFTGTIVSNLRDAYRTPNPDHRFCPWPSQTAGLSGGAVVVEFDQALLEGSIGQSSTTGGNLAPARFPLTLDQAYEGGGGPEFIRYELTVRLVGVDRPFTVRVWFGTAASKADVAVARRVLASIRPSGPAVTPSPIPTVIATPLELAVTATPDHGPVGTRVHLEGEGFTDSYWQSANQASDWAYGISLIRAYENGCEGIASSENISGRIDPDGHLVADFTVAGTYTCFQRSGLPGPVTPGTWSVVINCHACGVGTFEVTKD